MEKATSVENVKPCSHMFQACTHRFPSKAITDLAPKGGGEHHARENTRRHQGLQGTSPGEVDTCCIGEMLHSQTNAGEIRLRSIISIASAICNSSSSQRGRCFQGISVCDDASASFRMGNTNKWTDTRKHRTSSRETQTQAKPVRTESLSWKRPKPRASTASSTVYVGRDASAREMSHYLSSNHLWKFPFPRTKIPSLPILFGPVSPRKGETFDVLLVLGLADGDGVAAVHAEIAGRGLGHVPQPATPAVSSQLLLGMTAKEWSEAAEIDAVGLCGKGCRHRF